MKIFTMSGEVQERGLRMQLINLGFKYGLRVYPRNIEYGKNVEVIIVNGGSKEMKDFYEFVRDNDVRLSRTGSMYILNSLTEYKGPPPDRTQLTLEFILEQLAKGAYEYFQIKKLLEKLVEDKQNT